MAQAPSLPHLQRAGREGAPGHASTLPHLPRSGSPARLPAAVVRIRTTIESDLPALPITWMQGSARSVPGTCGWDAELSRPRCVDKHTPQLVSDHVESQFGLVPTLRGSPIDKDRVLRYKPRKARPYSTLAKSIPELWDESYAEYDTLVQPRLHASPSPSAQPALDGRPAAGVRALPTLAAARPRPDGPRKGVAPSLTLSDDKDSLMYPAPAPKRRVAPARATSSTRAFVGFAPRRAHLIDLEVSARPISGASLRMRTRSS